MNTKNTEVSQPDEEHEIIQSTLERVLGYISFMDIEMLDCILDEEMTYNGFDKKDFLHRLNRLFARFVELKDYVLYSHAVSGENYYFIADTSENILTISVKTDAEGKIGDIYNCYMTIFDDTSSMNIKLGIEDDLFAGVCNMPLVNIHPKFIVEKSRNSLFNMNKDKNEEDEEISPF